MKKKEKPIFSGTLPQFKNIEIMEVEDDDEYMNRFWEFIKMCDIKDRSSSVETYVNTSLSEKYKNTVERLMVRIDDACIRHKIYRKMERKLAGGDEILFRAHIVARGREFYEAVMLDPTKALYLIDKTASKDETNVDAIRLIRS